MPAAGVFTGTRETDQRTWSWVIVLRIDREAKHAGKASRKIILDIEKNLRGRRPWRAKPKVLHRFEVCTQSIKEGCRFHIKFGNVVWPIFFGRRAKHDQRLHRRP